MENALRILLIACCFCLCGSGFAQAEMNLLRSGMPIADGATDSISYTGTSPFNVTYTIANDGTTDLNLTLPVTFSNQTNCTVSQLSPPSTPVTSGGGTTTFTLQVSPTSATGFSFDLSIINDDTDENPYNITFSGSTGPPTSSSSGGGGDSGCSSGETQGRDLLVWLGLLALAVAALRVARDSSRAVD